MIHFRNEHYFLFKYFFSCRIIYCLLFVWNFCPIVISASKKQVQFSWILFTVQLSSSILKPFAKECFWVVGLRYISQFGRIYTLDMTALNELYRIVYSRFFVYLFLINQYGSLLCILVAIANVQKHDILKYIA